jgi:hypothetical protein
MFIFDLITAWFYKLVYRAHESDLSVSLCEH